MKSDYATALQTVKSTEQTVESAKTQLAKVYAELVRLVLAIPRTNTHSTGHSVTIYTHPDGYTIHPDFPAYTIANGKDDHVWGMWKPSGSVGGSLFFEQNAGEVKILDQSRLLLLIEHLAD